MGDQPTGPSWNESGVPPSWGPKQPGDDARAHLAVTQTAIAQRKEIAALRAKLEEAETRERIAYQSLAAKLRWAVEGIIGDESAELSGNLGRAVAAILEKLEEAETVARDCRRMYDERREALIERFDENVALEERVDDLERRLHEAERERDEAREPKCYCGIPGEPCDGWHSGLCYSASKAPEGSRDWHEHRRAAALELAEEAIDQLPVKGTHAIRAGLRQRLEKLKEGGS